MAEHEHSTVPVAKRRDDHGEDRRFSQGASGAPAEDAQAEVHAEVSADGQMGPGERALRQLADDKII
jgi:hypothetical protein